MPRFIASLILTLSLLIPASIAASKKTSGLTVVAPITRFASGGQGICTTWAVDSQMWMTAAHCVLPETEFEMNEFTLQIDFSPNVFMIDNSAADVVAADPSVDLAMLYTPSVVAKNPYQLKTTMPKIDSMVEILGYPRMWSDEPSDRPLSFDAKIKAEYVQTHCSAQYQMVMQGTALGGNSGSPALQNGKVVSVLQCSYGAVVTGATWFDLTKFVAAHVHQVIPA